MFLARSNAVYRLIGRVVKDPATTLQSRRRKGHGTSFVVSRATQSGAREVERKHVGDAIRAEHRHQQAVDAQGDAGAGWQAMCKR